MTHNSLDILITTNHAFCNQVEHSLRTIMKTGNLISGTSADDCNSFFNSIFEKLEEFTSQAISSRYVL